MTFFHNDNIISCFFCEAFMLKYLIIFSFLFLLISCVDRVDGAKQNSGCSSNADCKGGEICNTETKKCELFNQCTDCTESQICNPVTLKCMDYTSHLCEQCTKDSDCGTIDKCQTLTNGKFCTSFCDDTHSCPTGFDCRDLSDDGIKQCVPTSNTCEANKCEAVDCADGYICNPLTGECEKVDEKCNSDLDCDYGYFCNIETQKCEPKTQECRVNDDCESGYYCDQTTKTCKKTQVECTSDFECDFGMVCDLNTNKCIPKTEECTSNNQCPSGYYCDMRTNTCAQIIECGQDTVRLVL